MNTIATLPDADKLLSAAVSYAQRGWRVLPIHSVDPADNVCTCTDPQCGSPGKHPLTPDGVKSATTDETTIRRWWTEAPQANVAIATGEASGIFVIDLDGSEGCRAFIELCEEHEYDRRTFTVETGHGSHLYFRWPEPHLIKNRTKINGLPIDCRGEGGYILTVPSFHKSGRHYRIDLNLPVADAPSWLVDFVASEPRATLWWEKSNTNGHVPPLRVTEGGADLPTRVKAYLAKCPPAISGQRGHDVTFAVCCAVLHHFNLSPDEAYPFIQEWNARCQPAWSERELRHKLADASKAEGERGKFLRESNGSAPSVPVVPVPSKEWPRPISAPDVLSLTLPEPRFVVPGLITEGLNLVGGKPKIGKSWLALQSSIGVSNGGQLLDQIVTGATVLYLGLEDNMRRMKNRLEKLLHSMNVKPSPRLHVVTEWPRTDAGGLDAIAAWVKSHSDTRLIVIDTLARIRPTRARRGDMYGEDYADVAVLKQIADENQLAILVVHHQRKMSADDAFDTISGTLGLTGAADTVLVLQRSRMTPNSILHITGRDIEEQQLALKFDHRQTIWSVVGQAADVERSEQEQAILAILQKAGEAMSPKAILDELDEGTTGSVKMRLRRMVDDGTVEKAGRGKYQAK